MRRWLAASAVLFVSCSAPEFRIGAKDGIPPIKGSTEVTLDAFVCGNPIPAGEITVATRKVTGGCELSFDKDIEVLKASDYTRLPELNGATNLLQAVELTITTLSFTDTGVSPAVVLDPATRITSVTLSVNDQIIADKPALASLPKTVSLNGAALSAIKAKVDKRLPASVKATCVAVIPDDPPPPKKLKIDYDTQPTLVLGTGQITLPTK